jgi:hypothetical protein
VTSYLDEHPGGDDVVLAATGIFLMFPNGWVMIWLDRIMMYSN